MCYLHKTSTIAIQPSKVFPMAFFNKRISDPDLQKEIRDLVSSHQMLKDEPLLFAMYYDPNRGQGSNDLFIFEVLDGFGDNKVDPDGDLFEVEFGASSSMDIRLPVGSKLHLVLTNPIELTAALNRQWPKASELANAIARGEFEILFEDAQRGGDLRKQLLPPEAAE
jgi:hypothetical protein